MLLIEENHTNLIISKRGRLLLTLCISDIRLVLVDLNKIICSDACLTVRDGLLFTVELKMRAFQLNPSGAKGVKLALSMFYS